MKIPTRSSQHSEARFNRIGGWIFYFLKTSGWRTAGVPSQYLRYFVQLHNSSLIDIYQAWRGSAIAGFTYEEDYSSPHAYLLPFGDTGAILNFAWVSHSAAGDLNNNKSMHGPLVVPKLKCPSSCHISPSSQFHLSIPVESVKPVAQPPYPLPSYITAKNHKIFSPPSYYRVFPSCSNLNPAGKPLIRCRPRPEPLHACIFSSQWLPWYNRMQLSRAVRPRHALSMYVTLHSVGHNKPGTYGTQYIEPMSSLMWYICASFIHLPTRPFSLSYHILSLICGYPEEEDKGINKRSNIFTLRKQQRAYVSKVYHSIV